MPIDVWTLIDRDHRELENVLDQLVDHPDRNLLDAARIGFAAHVEAEGKALLALFARNPPPHIAALFTELAAAHRAQERALVRLVSSPQSEWSARAQILRDMIHQHNEYERTWCVPVVRARVPPEDFGKLVATYATERLRALALTWPLAEVASARA